MPLLAFPGVKHLLIPALDLTFGSNFLSPEAAAIPLYPSRHRSHARVGVSVEWVATSLADLGGVESPHPPPARA
jgi:hypothetical protein